jgi:hypothetical protein
MLLLLPWQLCTCSDDGAHLKAIWDASACEPETEHAPSSESPTDRDEEQHCDGLFLLPGAAADAAVALPKAQAGADFGLQAALLQSASYEPLVETSGWPWMPDASPGSRSTLAQRTRLQV